VEQLEQLVEPVGSTRYVVVSKYVPFTTVRNIADADSVHCALTRDAHRFIESGIRLIAYGSLDGESITARLSVLQLPPWPNRRAEVPHPVF
jgi:hypothetical protein